MKKQHSILIFGASGDLAKLKLYPAIFELFLHKKISKKSKIIGFSRSKFTNTQFKNLIKKSITQNTSHKIDKKTLEQFLQQCHYNQGQYDQPEHYQFIKKHKNLICYLSVPPFLFQTILQNIATHRTKKQNLKIIIEKPFGQDQKSATKLFHCATTLFKEKELFLLDHYLGKPAVQNLLHLRHANRLINMMLKGESISKIEVSALEEIGVETRQGYFDKVGIIKDMMQSHLLQILALITMQIPITENAASIQQEKANILSALQFTSSKHNLVLGKYKGYKGKAETYAAIKLKINHESWHNTPIFIRSGKKNGKKHTYIVIELKKFSFQSPEEKPNRIIIQLQPKNIITTELISKNGQVTEYKPLQLSSACATSPFQNLFSEQAMLLMEIIADSKKYFLSFPEIIASWKLIDQVKIQAKKQKTTSYKQGTLGPRHPKNFNWHNL